MGDTDIRAARERIETVEKRLAAMQDAGGDVAALRAQLAFAHHALREGRMADIEAICDEVLSAARRLAELGTRGTAGPSVRTPAHGTPVGIEPGTESLQKVKVAKAQLAEEVRAAIDAEVRSQMQTSPLTPAESSSLLAERMAALEARLGEIAGHAADAAAVAGRLHTLNSRLAALESQAPAPAAASIESMVRTVIDEVVPHQASELLREAIAKLPTRDDLHQIADTLRADLDWRLEKAAAEHGWCSLADVQTTVRKSLAEQDPSGQTGGSQLGRLELALADFVQQSKEQQERLISALADRVVQRTKSLTKRMLVRESPTPSVKHDTEELSPSASSTGDGSSRMAAITSVARESVPGKAPTEMMLDPVPPEAIEASRRDHGSTTMLTKRIQTEMSTEPTTVEPPAEQSPEQLHELVTAEVERALRGASASTMTNAPTPLMESGDGSSSSAKPVALTATNPASPVSPNIATQIAAEVGRQLALTVPMQLPPSDSDLARAIARTLPQALQDEAVRTELFAVLALEAAGKPGALGELTGLRRYLKRELQAAAEQLASQPVTM